MAFNMSMHPEEDESEHRASVQVNVMRSESRESPNLSTRELRRFDGVLKIGGTTFGGTAIGAAVGNLLGPVGAASGAVIGGLAGAALSTWDAFWRHRPE